MEIVRLNYHASMGLYDDLADQDRAADGDQQMLRPWLDDDDCATRCCDQAPSSASSSPEPEVSCRDVFCSRIGKAAISLFVMMLIYIIFIAMTTVPQAVTLGDPAESQPRAGINIKRATEILTQLCDAYDEQIVTGDSCSRLCYKRSWEINDFYEGNKVVLVLKDGGQLAVFKSSQWSIRNFPEPERTLTQDAFSDKVLDLVNSELRLGWPREFKRHLMETVWPTLLRNPGVPMSQADRLSLWGLLQQPEFILFRVLPLTRVTPKLIGTCGHFYETEALVAFRMKKYYLNLKGKILVHIMGTLKLLYEFINEPLQWCDVKFENLGLSADYPKRFVLMDGDEVYTQSKLTSLLKGRPCESDTDCAIGDCQARCMDTLTCSDRTNSNLEVFCEKLVHKLYGTSWSKNNRYLAACNDPSMNVTQRLLDLRLSWSWNMPDV